MSPRNPNPETIKTFHAEIKKLYEMGFTDAEACLMALKQSKGSVNGAVDILFGSQASTPQIANKPDQSRFISADDPWSKFDNDKSHASSSSSNHDVNGAAPPLFMEDPFADWNK